MHIDDMIDGVIMILLLAIFIPITISSAIPLYQGDLGGFGVQIEKSALQTKGEVSPSKRAFTSHDTMLLLAVADNYSPEPKIIEINGTAISIDTAFLANRLSSLQNAYTAMPTLSNMTIDLYVGPSGLRKWVIKDE